MQWHILLSSTWVEELLCLDMAEELEAIKFVGDYEIYNFGGIAITTKDLGCMQPGRFVPDGTINLLAELLNTQLKGICYVFSTLWTDKLKQSKFKSVMTFKRGVKLPATLKYVFYPFHDTNHWTLVVADIAAHELIFCDSLFTDGSALPECVDAVGKCLTAQRAEWTPWTCLNGKVTTQTSTGMDCAIAVCYNIVRVISLGTGREAFSYPADYLRLFRQKLKVMLLYRSLAPQDVDMVQNIRCFQSWLACRM